ncbi:MAG: hypothetical protein ACTSWZ_07130 [Candidatus Heimdallarchaeaceae archaeon]
MNYTLKDRGYFEILKIVSEEFSRQKIRYALVGGAGVQARIADILSKAQETDVSNVQGLENLLRGTKDLDITSNASEEDFIKYFNEVQALNPAINISSGGVRSKKFSLKGRRGKELVAICLNYQTGPQDLSGLDESFYNECIQTSEILNLNYGNKEIGVSVAKPEYLVASKLTRSDTKDIWDIGALLRTIKQNPSVAREFNPDKVKELLERANRGEIYGRLDEIRKQILAE